MRVVLDVNVFVSALIAKNSNPGRVLELWEQSRFELLISPQILGELERVIRYLKIRQKYDLPDKLIQIFLESIGSQAAIVHPETGLDVIADDPSDNRYLECAVAGDATIIVTGDRHLLELKEYQEIVILHPAGFVALFNQA